MNAQDKQFSESNLIKLAVLGYGAVTLEGQIVDRGFEGNMEMGILTNGNKRAVMAKIHELYLADGWEFKISPLDGKTPVDHDYHTIFVKDGRQIGFYAMNATVEVNGGLIKAKEHYFSVGEESEAY
ncbi:hypothetical protein G646_gp115 [Serratia phage phiMAM1]|uniref:Uncharacterized protein n=2 Tax=Miltonvirus MAM1 TaxID=2169689 RepID=K7Z9P7_9CAUD|nr:hypothetical protein G646_gp115 [Serratia phage phiMAM1]AFX93583.1 hypothetical protein MAM_115 [Serratia phage phiMAM1]ASZ78892.1 hypothetical protein 2050H1_126 [Serratia phage 2050H1]